MCRSIDEYDYDVVAYCDGSCDSTAQRYSYGVILLESNGAQHYFADAFGPDSISGQNNIAGEIIGATICMRFAQSVGAKSLLINFDYLGIQGLCQAYDFVQKDGSVIHRKRWSPNTDLAKAYAHIYDELSELMVIDFSYTRAHSGILPNEICDALAKNALGKKVKVELQQFVAVAKPYPLIAG